MKTTLLLIAVLWIVADGVAQVPSAPSNENRRNEVLHDFATQQTMRIRFVPGSSRASWSRLGPVPDHPGLSWAWVRAGIGNKFPVWDENGRTLFEVFVAEGNDVHLVVEVRSKDGSQKIDLRRDKSVAVQVAKRKYELLYPSEDVAVSPGEKPTTNTARIIVTHQDDSKSWKHPEPITYESIRAWHKEGGLHLYSLPKERYLDLKKDGSEEVFLGIEGWSRGMTYALFTKTKDGWVLLSDEIQGNRPFELLPAKNGLWHDFLAVTPTWRGRGLYEVIYTWDGKRYVKKSDREVVDSEISHP